MLTFLGYTLVFLALLVSLYLVIRPEASSVFLEDGCNGCPVLSLPASVTIIHFRSNVAGSRLELRVRITTLLSHFSGMGKQVRTSPYVGLDDERNRMVDV